MKLIKQTIVILCMVLSVSIGNLAFAEEASNTESSSVTENSKEDNTEKTITLTYYYDSEHIWTSISMYSDSVKAEYMDGPPFSPGDGYFFLYWEYMKDGEMIKVTEDTIFYEDTNLYAKWNILIDPDYSNTLEQIEENEKEIQKAKELKAKKTWASRIKGYRPKIVFAKNNKKRTVNVKISMEKAKDGYKIQYSTSKKFKKAKTITIKSTKKKLNKKIKKLKKGKTYYIRIRAYRIYDPSQYGSTDSKETFYSKWSKTKKIKITK